MKTRTPFRFAPAALALMAGAALAQTPAPQTAPQTAAPATTSTLTLDATLRAKGEQYHRAPDAEQNPAELNVTQRLNADVAARNEAADRQDAAAATEQEAAASSERAQYRADVTATEAENADRAAEARAVAAFNAEQRDRYEKAMADWRATMRACETGDTARCRAGQQRPIATDF